MIAVRLGCGLLISGSLRSAQLGLALRQGLGQEDLRPSVLELPVVALSGAQLHLNAVVAFLVLTRTTCVDLQAQAGVRVQDQTLEQLEVVEAVELQAGIAMQRAVREPFGQYRHGHDGLAVQDVRAQEGTTRYVDVLFSHQRQGGGSVRTHWSRLCDGLRAHSVGRGGAQDNTLDVRLVSSQLA